MISRTEIYKKTATPAALVLLFINLGFLCWYLFVGYQARFHSDSAVKMLIAREIVATGDYFPNDWNYVNKDLFVLFGHTFVIPLLGFMPAGYTAHAVAGLFSSVLILSSIWFLTSLAPLGTARRLLIIAIVAAGISGLMAENLFGQASYGTVIYFACYIVFFSWRFIIEEPGKKWSWGTALLVVIVLAFWANPQRALISYGIPLLAATLMFRIKLADSASDELKADIRFLFGIIALSISIGAFLHIQTIAKVSNVLGAGLARWLPYDLMLRNLSFFFKEYLAIFGGLPTDGNLVVSKLGAYEAGRLIAALTLLVLMPVAIIRSLQQRNNGLAFLSVYALVAFMAVLFLQITTTIPDMSDPIQSARYLLPSLFLIAVIVLVQPVSLRRSALFGFSVVFLSVLFVTSAYTTYVLSNVNSILSVPGQYKNQRIALIDFLARNDLHYGYGTYWNAGVFSVLSNENVLIRQVVIDSGIPMPMRHLSSNRWYRASAWRGKTFLLLTSQEAKAIDWERLKLHRVQPSRELTFGDYKIYIFAENIAINLPGWDRQYGELAAFTASTYSLHQVGRFREKSDQFDAALVAEIGQSGALHYGPYVDVEPGRYVVTFDVFARSNPAGVVRLDVAAAPDQKLFGEKLLLSCDRPQEIIFTLDETRTMEFRVWALGYEQVVFKGVTIKRISDSVKSITEADKHEQTR